MLRCFMKYVLVCILLVLAGQLTHAQETAKTDTLGRIEGRITDMDGVGLRGVTLRVMTADSIFRTGAIADSTGVYRIKGLQQGSYIMQYSLIGYNPGFVNFNITSKRPAITAPVIQMTSNDRMLNEAVVVAMVPPVTVIDDTVAYNADAYAVPEGAMVEELIESIPGAEITDDGQIKINGKIYSKILVDGKEFFGDDPQAALKNLPANIIKRIKTYDRKSDRARLTGIDDGEEHNVIDLEVKPNMFKGLVGAVSGAMGNHDRYSTNFNVNRFRKDRHLSIMAGMNNVNKPGFAERGGGAMNFSDAARPGNSVSKSVGMSYAREKKNKYKVSGNVRYGFNNSEQQSERQSETMYNDSTFRFGNNNNHSERQRHDLNANFELEWKPDTLTTLQLRPNFSYGKTDNASEGKSMTDSWTGDADADTICINQQMSHSNSNSHNVSSSASFNVFRRLSAKGRHVNLSGSYSYSDGKSESYSRNKMTYFLQPKRNRDYNRYSDGNNHNLNYSFGLSYNEPIVKYVFFQANYNYSYGHSRGNRYGHEINYTAADSLIDKKAPIDWSGVPVDILLSSCTGNTYMSHTFNANFRYVSQKANLNLGARFNPRHNEVNYIFGQKMDKGLVTQNLMNWSPNVQFKYRFAKRTTLNLNYRGNSNDPNIDDLQEIIDKSNPQNIRYGNPSLKPSYVNNLSINFNHYSEKTHRSLVTNWNYSNENVSTSNMRLSESSTGVRVSKLMNVDGRWSMGGNVNFNSPLDTLEHFNISTETSADYNESANYNSTPLTADDLKNAGVTVDFQEIQPEDIDLLQPLALKNFTHTLRLRQNLSFRYRIKTFSVNVGGGVNYYKVDNSIQKANKRETINYTANLRLQADLPFELQIATNMRYTSRHGYAANVQKNIAIWNAQVSWRFLKRKAGLLTFQIFDLLHQRSNIERSVNNLTISDTRTESLRDYFMLGFQYRINTMGRGRGGKGGSWQGKNSSRASAGNNRNAQNRRR